MSNSRIKANAVIARHIKTFTRRQNCTRKSNFYSMRGERGAPNLSGHSECYKLFAIVVQYLLNVDNIVHRGKLR